MSEIDTFNIDFYKYIFPNHACHFDLPNSSNIGGAAIYKEKHKITEKSEYKIQSLGDAKVENLWYEITKGSKSYIVGTIYRHSNHNVEDFTEKLANTLSLLTEKSPIKNCIITGNLNIDLMKFDLHETTSDYLNTFLSYSFMPASILPTRVTDHSATLTDNMFYYTKNFKGNTSAGNLFTDITDYFSNFLILGSSRIKNTNCGPMVTIFSDKNKQNFKNKLNQYYWNVDIQTKNSMANVTRSLQSVTILHFQFYVYQGRGTKIILCPKRTKRQNSVGRLVTNGKTIKNDKEIANALNTYFTNIGQDLSGEIIPTEQSFMDYLPNIVPKGIFIKPTDVIEIATEINLLHNKKSVLDIFNISIIKYKKDEIIPALVIIFNKSITEGIFPEMLKTAKVTPIFKKDFITGNYRPISLLRVFDKLLENVIYRRLKSFLDKFKILYKYRFGFRTNHSTSHALIDIAEYMYKAPDKGHFVFGIYSDLIKKPLTQ